MNPLHHSPSTGAPEARNRLAAWLLALALGFGGVVFLSFLIPWFETVIFRQVVPSQLVGNALVPGTLFLFFLLVALLNPALRRFLPSCALDRRHLLAVLALWVLAGLVALNTLGPILHASGVSFAPPKETAEMKRLQVLKNLNPALHLPADASRAYYFGLEDGMSRVALSKVPWRAWMGPLAFAVLLSVAMVVMAAALVRVVHRQWSRHELLTYPLADFLSGLLTTEPGRAFPPLLRDRFFWGGFVLIAFVLAVNGLRLWFPQMVEIPLGFSQIHLLKEFPFLSKYCGSEGYSLLRGFAFPFMVSIAVLLPTEVSLTCWVSWVLFVLGTGGWFLATGEPLQLVPLQNGLAVAMGAILVFIGRHEYRAILRHAVRLAPPDDPGLRGAVTACRIFVLAAILLWTLFVRAGLDWPLAGLCVGSLSLGLLLCARITAEIGIPFLPGFTGTVATIPLKLLGPAVFGPQGLVVVNSLNFSCNSEQGNSVAAQETSRRKLEEPEGAGWVGRLNGILTAGLALSLAATTFFILWNNYSFGARQETRFLNGLFSAEKGASLALVGAEIGRLRVESSGALDSAAGGFQRLWRAKPEKQYWRFFSLGVVLVGGCALLRLRFSGWPFHPLPLLLLGSYILSRLYFAFLLGWLIKVALLRIAGGRVFARSKPFFFGVIAGSVAMSGFWLVVGILYYLSQDIIPPVVNFFI
ncbi:MAG: hypothetical protein IT578_00990 [Verrucomicrobiae bacterium]|nr:hypothetical protein [Verrucomicrobiae bacterium]